MVAMKYANNGKSPVEALSSPSGRKRYVILVILATATLLILTIPKSAVSSVNVKQQPLRTTVKKCRPIFHYKEQTFIQVPLTNTRECLMDHGASPYIDVMSKLLVGTPLGGTFLGWNGTVQVGPYNEIARSMGKEWPMDGYTMVGKARMHNVRCAIDEVNRNGIKGAVVELGVWRGGVMMLASAIGMESGIERDIYLLDAFALIGSYDYNPGLGDYLDTSVQSVKDAFSYWDLGGPHVHFEKGLFKDSLPPWKNKDFPIAILRIDGNFYDSYQDAMYYLYEKVPVGGFVIFDDILTSPSVERFWEEFRREQGMPETFNLIDKDSAWFRKEKDVKLNWSYFRAPQDVNKR
jgi:O-methyltransferase